MVSVKRFSNWFLFFFGSTIFLLLCIFASGNIESEDGSLYLSVARNVYYQHAFISPPQTDYPLKNINMNSGKGADGVWRPYSGWGYALSMVPAVALSDLLHQYYQVPPPQYFPLESDWSVLLFAGFTNCFWAALVAVLLVKYGEELGWSKPSALAFSLITIFTTNLFPMAKFSFAQMIFTFFLLLCFYFMRKFARQKRWIFLIGLGISFVALKYTYNASYYLSIPPLILYYIFLHDSPQREREIKKLLVAAVVAVAVFPKFFYYLVTLVVISPKVLFEGIFGFIFSAGKSIFLYSPPLLLIPVFWHKFPKKILPELIAFGTLAAAFIIIIGSIWIPNPVGKTPIWNGGMIWGPRYLVPLIPGLMILVYSLYQQLGKWQQRLIFYPLLFIGLGIQLVGSSAIYLLQYSALPFSIFVEKEELSLFDYASFIPRYSPLWKMPHITLALARRFPQTIMHGRYNVRLYDGFDIPLTAGPSVSRGFREEGHISWEMPKDELLRSVQLTLHNVPDKPTATEAAHIMLESHSASVSALTLAADQEATVSLPLTQLQSLKTFLDLEATYSATPSAPHVIYIKKMSINDEPVNLGSIDYPDVSSLGVKTTPMAYQYYGGKVSDPWKLWYMRARINERTFDFWWLKNLYYWDRPQTLIWILFGANLTGLAVTTLLAVVMYRREVS